MIRLKRNDGISYLSDLRTSLGILGAVFRGKKGKIMKDEVKQLKMTDLKPYWRNPNQGNVEQVKRSIKAYGYQEYIIADKSNVIIAGHTRYKAIQELLIEYPTTKDQFHESVKEYFEKGEFPVIISVLNEKEAKEYRIIDNQTARSSEWLLEKLSQEAREIGNDVLVNYFPQEELDRIIKIPAGAIDYKPVTPIDISNQENKLEGQMTGADQNRKHLKQTIICPHCGEEIEID